MEYRLCTSKPITTLEKGNQPVHILRISMTALQPPENEDPNSSNHFSSPGQTFMSLSPHQGNQRMHKACDKALKPLWHGLNSRKQEYNVL